MSPEDRQKLIVALRQLGNPRQPFGHPISSTCEKAADEIEQLAKEVEETIASSDAVCDSYVKENQQLSDEIERLAAELEASRKKEIKFRTREPQKWVIRDA